MKISLDTSKAQESKDAFKHWQYLIFRKNICKSQVNGQFLKEKLGTGELACFHEMQNFKSWAQYKLTQVLWDIQIGENH